MLRSLSPFWKTFIGSYFTLVVSLWGFLEAYTYFQGDHLKRIAGPYWWALYAVPLLIALIVAFLTNKSERLRRFFRWLASQWRYFTIAAFLILIELALYLHANWYVVAFSAAHFALVAFAAWLLSFRRSTRHVATTEAKDVQQVIRDAVGLPLGTDPSRIFHMANPCVLPVCFKNPKRSEYIYIVVDTRVDNPNAEDNRARIATRPGLAPDNIASVTVARARWYQLSSDKPLEWIRFGDGPTVEDFMVLKAEIHPVEKWNRHDPQVVPGDRELAYGLAITEQIESSTWFVSIDDRKYSFWKNLGCHFVEFVLLGGQQHKLSFGYMDGPRGIASAFFAF